MTKDKIIQLRVTLAQRDKLKRLAKRAGLTVRDLLLEPHLEKDKP